MIAGRQIDVKVAFAGEIQIKDALVLIKAVGIVFWTGQEGYNKFEIELVFGMT